ncbi:hypothetical protein ACYFX5_11820 [Bremerella sp. T1]|uniref:hypothetical protein n=1 Tax=Bremerella sp. TYQ1 TaxID=3119568 RepID=UPI001CCC261B|nr:hypothetical protein [Bremerella volcania]UBM33760.1 hypothetical protein LA756_13765 [Bremerella volcania]
MAMISISGKVLQQLRTMVRKGLCMNKRQSNRPITFIANQRELSISISSENAILEYRESGSFVPVQFAAPLALMRECSASTRTDVLIKAGNEVVDVSWFEGAIPQQKLFPRLPAKPLPREPEQWCSNNSELMTALRDASGTADSESSQYALNCIRLRGHDGQLAATDGRQLLVQDGFSLPWEGQVLIPASPLFSCADLQRGTSTDVACQEAWVVFRNGPWSIWLKIDKTSRFPEVDSLVPTAVHGDRLLALNDEDAAFLQQNLQHLPGTNAANSPITVDLNGKVVFRARDAEKSSACDLIMSRSRWTGKFIRFAVNRHHLARAVQLGFRNFQVDRPESPVVAKSDHRTFVWANLCQESAFPPSDDAMQVDSADCSVKARRPDPPIKRDSQRSQKKRSAMCVS